MLFFHCALQPRALSAEIGPLLCAEHVKSAFFLYINNGSNGGGGRWPDPQRIITHPCRLRQLIPFSRFWIIRKLLLLIDVPFIFCSSRFPRILGHTNIFKKNPNNQLTIIKEKCKIFTSVKLKSATFGLILFTKMTQNMNCLSKQVQIHFLLID